MGKIINWVLDLINAVLDELNYTIGNPHFQKDPDGSIVYRPSWVSSGHYRGHQFIPDDGQQGPVDEMAVRYFHRCTLRGCGCGYDGLWIYPGNCPALRDDIKYGRYKGY